uniref:EPS8-like 3a n=1 Tax=Stegastes partitus TaxID=144197 RepID=A0A3B4ZRV6_9TELE
YFINKNGETTLFFPPLFTLICDEYRALLSASTVQRMEYATSINKMMDKFQYRVEHLFTCDLDGREMRNIRDCVERLKLLDEMGRVWGQNMLLELRDANLLLTDIESKEELDSLAVSDIQELEAVLDAGGFNSLLTVSVQQRRKHTTKVYLFQCDDIRVRTRGDDGCYHEPNMTSFFPLILQDILNHILGDIEIFMGQVAAAEAKNAKKKKKKKKGKVIEGMPPREEFATCLHQVKCGLNLLGELKGQISSPSAGDFVHSFFSTIGFVVSHCPEDLPPSIVAPLLTPYCIRLMSEEASTEEDTLWQSLGDAWNIPRFWPEDDEDIPTYTLEFSDGWQPPEVSAEPEPSEPVRRPANSPPAPRQPERRQENPPPSPSPGEGKQMRVKHDFTSRNSRELSVSKGEVVELLDMSKQWWKVRNRRGEEGFIPNNLLESDEDKPDEEVEVSPVLTKKAKPAEVKAWLEDKGFSKITVRCLGVLSGSMLLGMTREELKSVCPEEGGRVFYQLQLVKSTLALFFSFFNGRI